MTLWARLWQLLRTTRSTTEQARLDALTAPLTLYHYASCPFCVRVRLALWRRGLHVASHDVLRHRQRRDELVQGGGKMQVPCLRVDHGARGVTWMYESADIVRYLETLVADSGSDRTLHDRPRTS